MPATEIIKVSPEVKKKLDEAKPFDSMTYNDLVDDMVKQYEPLRPDTR